MVPISVDFLFFLFVHGNLDNIEGKAEDKGPNGSSISSASLLSQMDKSEMLSETSIDLESEKVESANLDVALLKASTVI